MHASIEIRLLTAAIELFGRDGLEAVGTRAVAEKAGAQMSAITYYFGGKDGLYLACARHIAESVGARVLPVLEESASIHRNTGPAGAKEAILNVLTHLTGVMMRDELADVARFVVREQMNPTAAFAVLYGGIMQRVMECLSRFLQTIAGGGLSDEELRIRSLALVGQVLTFRYAQATLLTATGWHHIGARETEKLRSVVLAHAGAILNSIEQTAALSTATGG